MIPNSMAATTNSNLVARAQDAFSKAETEFKAKPSDPVVAWQFARACFDLADFAQNNSERARLGEKGVAACRQSLARKSDSAEAHYYLGMNLGQIARTRGLSALKIVDEMESEFEAARKLDEKLDYAGPDRNLGLLYRDAPSFASIGSRVKARQHLQRAIELCPEYPETRIALAEACAKWGDRKGLTREWKGLETMLPEARNHFSGIEWAASWADWDARLAVLKQKTEGFLKPYSSSHPT
jgi:tetratricopeptide (TPR) repeat protein